MCNMPSQKLEQELRKAEAQARLLAANKKAAKEQLLRIQLALSRKTK